MTDPHHSRRRFLSRSSGCAAALLGLSAGTHWAAAAGGRPALPPPKGLRVFTCGHSFHVWAARMLADMAESAGIKDHQIAGVSSIGGSRVIQHWDVSEEKNLAKKALAAGKVDVLTLSPIWLPDEGIEHFAKLAVEHNPDIRVTVQEFWLPNDAYEPIYPLDTRKYVDHNAVKFPELRRHNDRYCHDIEEHLRAINQKLGKKALYAVPVGVASIALREKIEARQVRSLKVQWRLFADSWGHPTAPLRLLAAYCHYAVIYRRSPVGLPMQPDLEQNKEYAHPALNTLLQELAWEAVKNHPMTGLSEEVKS